MTSARSDRALAISPRMSKRLTHGTAAARPVTYSRSGVGAARSRRLVGTLRSVVPGIRWREEALMNRDAAHRDDSIHRATATRGEVHERRRKVGRRVDDGCADLAAIQTRTQFLHRLSPSVRANKPGSGAPLRGLECDDRVSITPRGDASISNLAFVTEHKA
jgi:hypothetical protein